VILVHPSTRALLTLAATLLVLLYFLPTILAFGRSATARWQIVTLNVLLGWTGAAWICALVLAFGPKQPRPPLAPPTRPLPRPTPRRQSIYADGVYLVSAGPDTHTWAIREEGRWRIVYEVGGDERLVGEVAEADVPLTVLATALESTT
jgi:hypothetical protein